MHSRKPDKVMLVGGSHHGKRVTIEPFASTFLLATIGSPTAETYVRFAKRAGLWLFIHDSLPRDFGAVLDALIANQ